MTVEEHNARITIDDSILGIWAFSIPNGDYLASLNKLPDGSFRLLYRFRYYRDDKAFDSEDVKNWYEGILSPDHEEIVVHKVSQTIKTMCQIGGRDLCEHLRGNKDLKTYMDEFAKLPFVHVQKIDKDGNKIP